MRAMPEADAVHNAAICISCRANMPLRPAFDVSVGRLPNRRNILITRASYRLPFRSWRSRHLVVACPCAQLSTWLCPRAFASLQVPCSPDISVLIPAEHCCLDVQRRPHRYGCLTSKTHNVLGHPHQRAAQHTQTCPKTFQSSSYNHLCRHLLARSVVGIGHPYRPACSHSAHRLM
jgi:hypothetical protein